MNSQTYFISVNAAVDVGWLHTYELVKQQNTTGPCLSSVCIRLQGPQLIKVQTDLNHPHRYVSLNRAKLPLSGLDRFPRPTTSSGRKLGSSRRHLLGSGLRHPPWEEGSHKLSLQMLRNNGITTVQELKSVEKQTPTLTINGSKSKQIIVLFFDILNGDNFLVGTRGEVQVFLLCWILLKAASVHLLVDFIRTAFPQPSCVSMQLFLVGFGGR